MIINGLEGEIFPGRRQKVSKSCPSKAFLTPSWKNFYANRVFFGKKVINFLQKKETLVRKSKV